MGRRRGEQYTISPSASTHVVIGRREIFGPPMLCTDVAPLVHSSQLALGGLCCATPGNEVQYAPPLCKTSFPTAFCSCHCSPGQRLRQEVKLGMRVWSEELPGLSLLPIAARDLRRTETRPGIAVSPSRTVLYVPQSRVSCPAPDIAPVWFTLPLS